MLDSFCVFMTHQLEKEIELNVTPSMPVKLEGAIVIPHSYVNEEDLFKGDIECLCKANAELSEALTEGKPVTVEFSLKDILDIVPRERRRADAYARLQRYLLTKGITLEIYSQKAKKKNANSNHKGAGGKHC